MRQFLPSLSVASAVAACLVSGSALAYATGQSGYSGKQGQSVSCMSAGCHSGGASTPTVTLEGPDTLAAGATGSYSLVIKGGPGARGGFNVAVDGAGASLGATTGSQVLSGELTHRQPKNFTSGEVRFDFTLVAPSGGGSVTLYGAGNSVNSDGAETGDASAVTSRTITITGSEDEGGGCAAAGGVPLLGAALMLLGASLRRRR